MHPSYKGLNPFTQQFILNILPQIVFQDDIPGLILRKPLGFRSKSGLFRGSGFLQNDMPLGENEHSLAQLPEDTIANLIPSRHAQS